MTDWGSYGIGRLGSWPPGNHDAWPPHPSMEVGYVDRRGRQWIHRPWQGWELQPARIAYAPRRRHWFHWVITGPACGLVGSFCPGWVGSVLVLAVIALGVAIRESWNRGCP